MRTQKNLLGLGFLIVTTAACGSISRTEVPGGPQPTTAASGDGGTPGGGLGTNNDAGPGAVVYPNCGLDQNVDADGDGYTPAQGDCNDCNPSINPGAIQIAGDPTDYACDGMAGIVPACDTAATGLRDPASLAQSFEQCDPRFFKSAVMAGPSDQRARRVKATFGVIKPRMGANFALLSNGLADDKSDSDFVEQSDGTDLSDSNTAANPAPSLPGAAGCSQSQPSSVNDYSELVLTLKAPTNANAFSFDFQFFSAEYPEYVCTEFNDEFLVLQKSSAYPTPTNVAFDSNHDPVTINNGFFTVCTNDTSKPQTQHCTQPVSNISGTGFEDSPGGISIPGFPALPGSIPGGSTGWLTTTSPVKPGEAVELHFIIFDEGDHVLDSSVLLDNFRWIATKVVTAPVTTPVQ